jgi:predicted NBD/HSP70 family sugar kinase
VRAIGVGVADPDPSLLKGLTEKFGPRVLIGNPAACAAAGEKYMNPAVSECNFLYIFSSLGKGTFVQKEEFFEDSYSEDAKYLRPWHESLGIVAETKREVAKGVGTAIVDLVKADLGSITEETVMVAAKQNDEIALGVLHSVAANLGVRIAYLVNLFAPQAVVIGGGLEKGGELMLENIRHTVKKLASKKLAERVNIMPSVVGEGSVSMGAASLAVREIFLRA